MSKEDLCEECLEDHWDFPIKKDTHCHHKKELVTDAKAELRTVLTAELNFCPQCGRPLGE
jgi:hypothetical protein